MNLLVFLLNITHLACIEGLLFPLASVLVQIFWLLMRLFLLGMLAFRINVLKKLKKSKEMAKLLFLLAMINTKLNQYVTRLLSSNMVKKDSMAI